MKPCGKGHSREWDPLLEKWWCRTCHNERRRGIRFQRKYQRTFLEANGDGPWPCDYCGELVPNEPEVFIVHHRDHNKRNGAADNLAPMHRSCHLLHHLRAS